MAAVGQTNMDDGNHTQVSRRDFIKGAVLWVGGLMGAVVGAPALAYLLSPIVGTAQDDSWIDLGPMEGYPQGVPTLFEFTRTHVNGWERTGINHGVFVVRLGQEHVRVFSNICTHLACRVSWHPDIQNYVSPCHDGHFDILGRNISGPPPRPLDEFLARIEDGKVMIQLPAFKRSS